GPARTCRCDAGRPRRGPEPGQPTTGRRSPLPPESGSHHSVPRRRTVPPGGPGRGSRRRSRPSTRAPAMTGPSWWSVQRRAELEPLLGHRRWWWHHRPFPHVRAVNVFRPWVYTELEAAFRAWLDEHGGGAPLAGHDLHGTTL